MPASVRQNMVGPCLAALRGARGLSQGTLAARCARLGWNLGEKGVAKIETQERRVTDTELIKLSQVLGIKMAELLPASERHLF